MFQIKNLKSIINKFTLFIIKNQDQIVLILAILLIAIISFIIGRLSVGDRLGEIRIKE
jgi:hypothetical protein